MALTVTATQTNGANGMALRIFVLTQAAAVQNGATSNTQFGATQTHTQSITTTQTGSRVYGAGSYFLSGAVISAAAATTVVDDVDDAVNTDTYVTFKATSLTGTPGATTLGFTSTSTAQGGPFAQAEILTAGTLTEDASGPAVASTTAAQTVVTASFTPPPGSLLVALTTSNGGAGVTTMAVSGGGLTWSELVKNNPSGGDYAGVWIAQIPAAAGGGAARPGQTWLRRFHHRQFLQWPPPAIAVVTPAPPLA